MPSPDWEFERELDAQLRDVPLPEGLLARLRQVALADDADLDAAVREVPLPPGLADRLRRSVLLSDDGLDEAIRDVPVPAGLLARLRRIPVQLPRAAHRWVRLTRVAEWVTAASLMIAIGTSYFGAMVAPLIASYAAEQPPRRELISSTPIELVATPEPPPADFPPTEPPGGGHELPPGQPDGTMGSPPQVVFGSGPRPRPSALAEVNRLFAVGARDDLFLDALLAKWNVLVAPDTMYDELEDPEKAPGLIRRGVDLPLVPGSNKPFLIRYGVHPFVYPASHPKLQVSEVPLEVDRASYDLTRRHLEDEELPPADAVRVEDFLAAVDYEFPPPKRGALGLSVATGPSPFGLPGLSLLQVGVQARDLPDRAHLPTHLVLAVDVSTSMRWGGRLEMIRRALRSVVRRLEVEDRISLVAFSEDAHVLVQEGSVAEADEVLAAIDLLAPRHATNVAAGLREAYAVARQGFSPAAGGTRVVLLTDGLADMGRGTTDALEQRLAEAAQQDIQLEVIDLRQGMEPDGQLASFARAGGGDVHRAVNADEIRWALLGIVTGRSQLVAADARLKITFNPKTVLVYRLFGHEAKAMAGLMPPKLEAEFHAGQSATALYELQLRPEGGNDVATVELSWRPPQRNSMDRLMVVHKVRRGQLGSSFVQAQPSLQEAALVAQTAEVLRRSPFARTQRGARRLAAVLELAEVIDTRVHERPTFVEFMTLVERADGARPYRSGGRR